MKKILTALSLLLSTIPVVANDSVIISQLKNLGVTEVEIKPAPIVGFKTAITNEGILYVSNDGKYLMQGRLFEMTGKNVIDVTSKILFDKLDTYKSEMIIYPAKNEKHVVTVFMDITCYYCNKLHKELKEYNDLGITVRYLAFPRAGIETQTAQQMEAIFTAKDPAFAMNEAHKESASKELKAPNIVKKHYALGLQFDVRGTPSIIIPNGEMIGGYLPPAELFAALEEAR